MSLVEPSSKLFADPVRKRWTGAEYDRLVDVGAFDHQRLELIEGEIFKMSPMNDPHSMAITLVQNALLACFDTGQYTVKVQCPMRLGEDSRPEPDVALLAGGIRAHDRHPTTALLVIEVADGTLEFDRDIKAGLYARHALPEYWTINLRQQVVEVYRRPSGGSYAPVLALKRGQTVSPLTHASCVIAVDDLLP
jgi:Uma2 family endonuclease